LNETEPGNGAGQDKILQQVEAVLVDCRANPMRRQVPDLRGELIANIVADLADPNLLPIVSKWCEP